MTRELKIKTFLSVLCAAFMLALLSAPALKASASNNPGPGSGDHIPLRPDLAITQVTRVINRYNLLYVTGRINFQVTNIGSAYAPGFEIMTQWGSGYGNQQLYFLLQQGLAPGQSIWLQIDAPGYDLWAGNFQIWVDNTKSVTESDETNTSTITSAHNLRLNWNNNAHRSDRTDPTDLCLFATQRQPCSL